MMHINQKFLLHSTSTLCEEFNDLLDPIWQDANGNIKWPFLPGTTRYVDCIPNPQGTGQCICLIDERIEEYAQSNQEVAQAITNLLTLSQVQALGWFVDDPDSTGER